MCLFTGNFKFLFFQLIQAVLDCFRYNLKRLIKIMHQRVVQNYQFEQSKKYLEEGIETYLAKHATDKQHYLLKKVNIRQQNDRKKYQILINQVGILKAITHPYVAECLKMLKTSNNIYLVYDYCQGKRLQEALQNPKELTFEKKMIIAKNLIVVLEQLMKSHIVHGNLHTRSIVVGENDDLKVINFLYAHNLQNKTQMNVKYLPPASDFTPPEIVQQNIIFPNSDIYSVGFLLGELLKAELRNPENKLTELSVLIKSMKSQKPDKRPSIEKIKEVISQSNLDVKDRTRKKSADYLSIGSDNRLSHLRKPKSLQQNNDAADKNSSRNSISDSLEMEKAFVKRVLKRRNLALFLLEISENCLSVQSGDANLGIFLGCLLLKASTRIITGLLGFLRSEKDYKNQISSDEYSSEARQSFEQKQDSFELQAIILKQLTAQTKWSDKTLELVMPELDNEQKAVLSEEIKDSELKSYIIQYLKSILSNQSSFNALSNNQVRRFYLMSQIVPHGSYQKMFEQLISEDKISLDEQILYLHAQKMSREDIVDLMRKRVNKKK